MANTALQEILSFVSSEDLQKVDESANLAKISEKILSSDVEELEKIGSDLSAIFDKDIFWVCLIKERFFAFKWIPLTEFLPHSSRSNFKELVCYKKLYYELVCNTNLLHSFHATQDRYSHLKKPKKYERELIATLKGQLPECGALTLALSFRFRSAWPYLLAYHSKLLSFLRLEDFNIKYMLWYILESETRDLVSRASIALLKSIPTLLSNSDIWHTARDLILSNPYEKDMLEYISTNYPEFVLYIMRYISKRTVLRDGISIRTRELAFLKSFTKNETALEPLKGEEVTRKLFSRMINSGEWEVALHLLRVDGRCAEITQLYRSMRHPSPPPEELVVLMIANMTKEDKTEVPTFGLKLFWAFVANPNRDIATFIPIYNDPDIHFTGTVFKYIQNNEPDLDKARDLADLFLDKPDCSPLESEEARRLFAELWNKEGTEYINRVLAHPCVTTPQAGLMLNILHEIQKNHPKSPKEISEEEREHLLAMEIIAGHLL